MRLYERAVEFDLMVSINRCYFDADHGRIQLALDRLKDLEDELGENPKISYTEGMLRKDSLQQGIRAFNCFARALEMDPNYENAAVNAATYAPSVEKFRNYIGLASRLAPIDAEHLKRQLTLVEEGHHPYWERLIDVSEAGGKTADRGAFIELALGCSGVPEETELALRRERSQILRKLDDEDYTKRKSMGEIFPADERLALHGALEELDEATRLDAYDATFWNYKAAWFRLLGRPDESLQAADHAIELRPAGYPLPYHNKAVVLMMMKKIPAALKCAEVAMEQAEVSENKDEIQTLSKLIEELKAPLPTITLDDLLPVLAQVVKAALITANQELSLMQSSTPGQRSSITEMTALVKRAIDSVHPDPSNAMDYVPAVAELLSYFTPETLFVALQQIMHEDNKVFQNSLTAALYIAAHGERIMQRDALRLLFLIIFKIALPPGDADELRDQYRRVILAVAAAGDDEMSNLGQLMRDELARIHPELPALIADQEPMDSDDIARAERNILSKLQGAPTVTRSHDKSLPGGSDTAVPAPSCLPTVIGFICFGAGSAIGLIYQKPWISGSPNWLVGGSWGALIGYLGAKLLSPKKK